MPKINWKQIWLFFIWLPVISLLVYSRFINLGWGLPYPFHPDERNMANAIQGLNCEISIPSTRDKFQISNCFNPHFFAYGQFPLYLGYLGVLLMKFFDGDLGMPINFQEAVISLRIISALASVINVLIIIKIITTIKKLKNFDLFICLPIVIFSPFFIQFAHFGTTESLLMLFYSLIIYLSLLFIQQKLPTAHYLLLTSLFSGLALATKVSSIVFLVLPLFVIMTCAARSYNRSITVGKLVLLTVGFSILFAPHNLISFGKLLSSMQYESAVASGQIKVFYTRQFENTIPVIFQLTKIFPYALGWPVLVLAGLGMLGEAGWKDKKINLLRLAFLVYFLPHVILFAKWTRFMAPIFPLMLTFAVVFLSRIKVVNIIKIIIIIIATIPGIAYLSIYQNPDVRAQASEWIYKNIPENAYILSETGNVVDLPLEVKSYKVHKVYKVISFNFYDLDKSPVLQGQLKYHLSKADYIIVPSRRIFMNHPVNAYPLLNNYYNRLFSGSLGYKKVVEFTSYPRLNFQFSIFNFQLQLPDEAAEETWTVFDHPVIRIYEKTKGWKLNNP